VACYDLNIQQPTSNNEPRTSNLEPRTRRAGGRRSNYRADGEDEKARNAGRAPQRSIAVQQFSWVAMNLTGSNSPRLAAAQGVFKNSSRRREEADFGAKNTSASLPRRLRLLRGFLNSPWGAAGFQPCIALHGWMFGVGCWMLDVFLRLGSRYGGLRTARPTFMFRDRIAI
jgi:hypothetical protein